MFQLFKIELRSNPNSMLQYMITKKLILRPTLFNLIIGQDYFKISSNQSFMRHNFYPYLTQTTISLIPTQTCVNYAKSNILE